MLLIILWVLVAFIFAAAGESRTIGYWGSFALCVLLSPILGLVITICIPKKPVKRSFTCKWCKLVIDTPSHYCPRCFKDNDGFTAEENSKRFYK